MTDKVAWIGEVALGIETEEGRQLAFSLEENQQVPSAFKEGDPVEISNHPDHPSVAAMGLPNRGYYQITHVATGVTFRTWHRADVYKVESR